MTGAATMTAAPVLLCDDELLALAHSRQGSWTRPITTVDVTSASQLTAAVARGYRSLLIRGLLSQDSPDGAELLLPLALVGARPGIMATWVTEDLTPAPDAERYELFADPSGAFAAVTTGPGGVHAFVQVDGRDGLAFFADLTLAHQTGQATVGSAPFCVLVRGPGGELVGGFVIRAGEVTEVSRNAAGELAAGSVMAVEPTATSWRARIGDLLAGRNGGEGAH
jgi:hypothetical protein